MIKFPYLLQSDAAATRRACEGQYHPVSAGVEVRLISGDVSDEYKLALKASYSLPDLFASICRSGTFTTGPSRRRVMIFFDFFCQRESSFCHSTTGRLVIILGRR